MGFFPHIITLLAVEIQSNAGLTPLYFLDNNSMNTKEKCSGNQIVTRYSLQPN